MSRRDERGGGGRRSSRSDGTEQGQLEGETYVYGRSSSEQLKEPLVWALRRNAVREYLRPGPCPDSPRMGWDGLEIERLPVPTEQPSPRPMGGEDGGPDLPQDQARDPMNLASANLGVHGSAFPSLPGGNALTCTAGGSMTFRLVRKDGSRASGGQGSAVAVYRVVSAEGVRVRRGADPQSPDIITVPEGTELVVVEEVQDGNGGAWMRLSAPVEGWIGRKANTLVAVTRDLPAHSGHSGLDRDEVDTGEAAEVAMARELEDCMEEEAGTELYRRDDRLFGPRQGWRLPAGGDSGLRIPGAMGVSGEGGSFGGKADSRVPGERRARVVGHASVSGAWANISNMSISAAKGKLAATASNLAILHCRKTLLTMLLQCHKEVTRTVVTSRAAADASFSQRMAALVGARDAQSTPRASAPGTKSGVEAISMRASSATMRTRAASRQFSSFLQLVLFRGWRPSWWPLAGAGGWSEDMEGDVEHGEGRAVVGDSVRDADGFAWLDQKEPMSDCFRSLPVVLTPLVLSLLRAAAAAAGNVGGSISVSSSGSRSQLSQRSLSFGAHVEEAMLQSVAGQLRQATRIGHREHAWVSSSDPADMSDSDCLRHPRLPYVKWASRVVQAGSGAPAVPRRIFHAWAAGLRSPSLPVKQQVCAELSRLLEDAVQVVDRACEARVSAGEDGLGKAEATSEASAIRRLKSCVDLLPVERLRSLAERRMLKEGEDEPMLSRALQSIIDLVASAELALRVLRERQSATKEVIKQKQGCAVDAAPTSDVGGGHGDDRDSPKSESRSVLCFPSPTAYVALQGRDLEPPWTAEFWILRPNADGTWEDWETGITCPEGKGKDEDDSLWSTRPSESSVSVAREQQPVQRERRSVRKYNSERGAVFRCFNNKQTSVDLNQLPPVERDSGAPILFRAQSADAVGQNSEGLHALPSAATGDVVVPGVWDSREDVVASLTPDFEPPPSELLVPPPFVGGRRRSVVIPSGADSARRGSMGAPLDVDDIMEQRMKTTASAEEGEGKVTAARKGVEPAQYLASSQTGHIRIQAGGTLVSPSAVKSGECDGDKKSDELEQEGKVGDEGARPVYAESLCVSMGAAGEKDRAFDFMVPTGRWVHLAIVASSPAESHTTLYVDGIAVDTLSLRLPLPMGYLGAGPHVQDASATGGGGGGSFVGMIAQAR